MQYLELLSPARNLEIGIAAIDSGADAVYIAGPFFGARKGAGNSIEDIAALCAYAHRFGARIFVTVNISVSDEELPELHSQMLSEQAAGVDAFIVRDERIFGWKDITVPLHASTQCAIRTAEDALRYQALGASRLVLERELSLDAVREIREVLDSRAASDGGAALEGGAALTGSEACELEFFVHGALCVCYSGECRLSEYLDGRSADRGECIQACRSVYDLVDASGKVLFKDKALLSLKDFNLYSRLGDLASAGVCSFKIEGRLKSLSYVRNVTRAYSQALDALVEAHPEQYRRASFGRVSGGFKPDLSKAFNRGFTELYIDGERPAFGSGQGRGSGLDGGSANRRAEGGKPSGGKGLPGVFGWSSMDAPANLGTFIGVVKRVRQSRNGLEITVKPGREHLPPGQTAPSCPATTGHPAAELHNGDGFAFIKGSAIVGFRGDICEGNTIFCKEVGGLREGTRLYRNIDAAFEREVEKNLPKREIPVSLNVTVSGKWNIAISAESEDGRGVVSEFKADVETAENRQRAAAMFREQLSKRSGRYLFTVNRLEAGALPLLSAGILNSMRRLVADDLDAIPCGRVPLLNRRRPTGQASPDAAQALLSAQSSNPAPATTQPSCPPDQSGPARPGIYAGTVAPPESRANQTSAEPLMQSRYCIRYELGLCPVHQGAAESGPLFLVNNGRRLALSFDCRSCEMSVSAP